MKINKFGKQEHVGNTNILNKKIRLEANKDMSRVFLNL